MSQGIISYKAKYLQGLDKEQLKVICLLWPDGVGIDYDYATEDSLRKFILDSLGEPHN